MRRSIFPRCASPAVVLTFLLTFATSGWAADAYYRLALSDLKIVEGTLPDPPQSLPWRKRERARWMLPYAVLQGEGEVYVGWNVGHGTDLVPFWRAGEHPDPQGIHIRAPAGRDVKGWLYLPKSDWSGMVRVAFVVPAGQGERQGGRDLFLQAKEAHYRYLANLGIPGGAWFRYQMRQAVAERTGRSLDAPPRPGQPTPRVVGRASDYERTVRLFMGGRAVSENLQLDRLLPSSAPEPPSVPVASLPGIQIREFDFAALTRSIQPHIDPLSRYIPHDQYAVFFPSFSALATTIDEAREVGTPILFSIQPRAENVGSQERYERQLCLQLDAVSRALGPQLVRSVAVTGSDPYFRTGTDVAVLFQTNAPDVLTRLIAARQAAAADAHSDVQSVSGQIGTLRYQGVVTRDRRICSYLAATADLVVVTNSTVQLERMADVLGKTSKSLAELPEYHYFRHLYAPREDELAFVMLSDATIRRWCSPRWRIATSRRTRAAAVMAEYQARYLDALVRGMAEPTVIDTRYDVPDLGTLRLTSRGVSSSTYGTLEFLTPIAELEFDLVTKSEADLYNRWRGGYERNWSRFFDPIAIRVSRTEKELALDVKVMPLILGSDYREMMQIVEGVELKPDSGDPHPQALLHGVMAVNADSQPVRQLGNWIGQIAGNVTGGPFSWVGPSIAVYADEDPFWKELAAADDLEAFLRRQGHRLPVAFTVEVRNSLKLAAFLTSLRAFADQAAPNLLRWETREHGDFKYVAIRPTELDDDFPASLAIYYAATPRRLTVSLNEDLVKRALDREARQRTGNTPAEGDSPSDPSRAKPRPWLGRSAALKIDHAAIQTFAALFGEDEQAIMQARAWANLPILNEWKRRYPDRDPLEVHETFWQARLVCPGGGTYRWNEEFQTMESTVYGHPGQPREGPLLPGPLAEARSLNFGLSFDDDSLEARTVIERDRKR